MNSICARKYIEVINSTFHTNPGDVLRLPYIHTENIKSIIEELVEYSKNDWQSYENSLEFTHSPLLKNKQNYLKIYIIYSLVRNIWNEITEVVKNLEEENNMQLIKAYNLQNELSPVVPLEQITLNCNPHYRYDSKKSDEELEALQLADTMKEFISYAVGCMFGRYSLDKPGLMLANQGESLQDYLRQVPESSFLPDEDNVIPVLEGEWFSDDIVERFKQFLRVTFGDEHYEENLVFIEEAIGRNIRDYFLKDFYKNHIQMYKKRPIYWMFSSPKGSFNVLIYMHRYQPDTISIILNSYLRQYRDKLTAHKSYQEAIGRNPAAGQSEKTKALKEIERVNKVLVELKEYEDEILYPLATQQIKIDLDDGVKVNYAKFGKALTKIAGL